MASPVSCSSIPKRPSPSQVTSYDDKPLWNHVTVVQNPGSGGNRKWTCNYCDKKVTGSYSKVKAHLLKLTGHAIVTFVLNHGKALTIFKNYSKHMLLKVAETRFASHVIMAERLFKVKNALEKMVLDVQWKTFRKTHLESKADTVKECVISDRWWDKIEYFLNFTTPIYNMIRKTDVDFPCLHLIYDLWDTMIEEVREKIFEHEGLDAITGDSLFFNVIQIVLEARWNKSNTPLHCMAHSLVPKYYSETWLEGGSSLVKRVAPNEDQDVSFNRDKCFKKMFPNPDELRKVNAEYGQFSGTLGFFSEAHVMDARAREDPLSWWASYGSSTPTLQALAFRLLSQPASSSCCERNWSSFANIQSIKRNRLASSRAEDLVYVHSNLRMLSRKKGEYTIGPSSFWDVGGDSLILDDDYIEAFENIFLEEQDIEVQD